MINVDMKIPHHYGIFWRYKSEYMPKVNQKIHLRTTDCGTFSFEVKDVIPHDAEKVTVMVEEI